MFTVKAYSTLKEISLDLSKLNKDFEGIATAVLSRKLESLAAGAVRLSHNTTNITEPVNLPAVEKSTAILSKLRNQVQILNNILTNLDHDFVDSDKVLVNNLKTSATKLLTKVKSNLEAQKISSHARTSRTINNVVKYYANNIEKELQNKWNQEGNIEYQDAIKDNKHYQVAYVVFDNITDSRGNLNPEVVIAITQLGDKVYINAGLHKVIPPGEFKIGWPIDAKDSAGKNPEELRLKQAIELTKAQLQADSHLAVNNPLPNPLTSNHINFNKEQNIASSQFDTNQIVLKFTPTTMNKSVAINVANNALIRIRSAMLANNPKSKARIVYALKNNGAEGWSAIYRFAAGSQYSGRDLNHDEVKHLQTVFSEREIQQIRRALGE